ncbi:MAG: type II restriction endonuclease subunit M [Mesorhizobium sp.]|nr:MAG: type II restriction endonuclease subunit M [Mesorhizobium sp.]
MTVFFRLIDESDKGEALLRLCQSVNHPESELVFIRNPEEFSAIPGTPFAYWALDNSVRAYRIHNSFERQGNFAGQGVATADNFRFIRLHWEMNLAESDDSSWFGLAKGGAATKYYGDIYLKILWRGDGAEFKAWAGSLYDNSHWSRITMNYAKYGLFGLTWSRRSMAFAVRALPAKCVFGDKGPAIFTETQTASSLLFTCALLNSKAYKYLLGLQLSRVDLAKSYETGIVGRTPFPAVTEEAGTRLASLALDIWRNLRILDAKNEISHAFLLPSLLLRKIMKCGTHEMLTDCSLLQADVDDIAFRLYGFQGKDRAAIETLDDNGAVAGDGRERAVAARSEDDEDEADGAAGDTEAMLSWAVGVSFGRFDIRLATGERPVPPEPGPFDPLPQKSPGMVPEGNAPFMLCRGVLVDDLGHADDLTMRVAAVYERVGEPVPHLETLRRSLSREFFPAHIRMYSKSRRKAPIYWQLSTPSASYSVWLYVHESTEDTMFRVQNDYVAPKLSHMQRQLEGIRAEAGSNPTGAQRKEILAQESVVEELQILFDEVKRVAPLWNPHPDDGVIINFSPLWRLVPQHKPWQTELKTTWNALCSGNFDWAHLALRLWPERVVPKCATDHSLAIAHGLEKVFWVESDDGKWTQRPAPTRQIDELVRERTSVAVKAALKELTEASAPNGPTARTRRSSS